MDHRDQVGTTWEDSKTGTEAWTHVSVRRGGLFCADCEQIAVPCEVCVNMRGYTCACLWMCVVSDVETLEDVPKALENTGEYILSEWQERKQTHLYKKRESHQTQRGYKVNPSVNGPVSLRPRCDASLEETLCAKRVRETSWQGKARRGGVVTWTVQRIEMALGSCNVLD